MKNSSTRVSISEGVIRDQFYLLLRDEDAAVEALPELVGAGKDDRKAFPETPTVAYGVGGATSAAGAERIALVQELLSYPRWFPPHAGHARSHTSPSGSRRDKSLRRASAILSTDGFPRLRQL